MYDVGKIEKYKVENDKTIVQLELPSIEYAEQIKKKNVKEIGLWIEDGRCITALQRKKIYATIKDISRYTGYFPEECKEWMKYDFIASTGHKYFSLSDCSVDLARDFIDHLILFVLMNGVELTSMLIERANDVGSAVYYSIKTKKCCVCGKPGEIHHWDAIGMGNDRRNFDDSENRKICLCRTHHIIAHAKGIVEFEKSYHLYGILYKEK